MTDQPSRLVFIRHGQSRSNLEAWMSSQATCGGLTDKGKAEAALARDYLAVSPDLAPDAIVVSTMRRAIETAAIVAEPTGLVAEQRAELIEIVVGEVEGMMVADYVAMFGHRPFAEWGPAVSPGGEDAVAFQTRVASAVDRLSAETAGRTTWVVCHGFVIRGAAHHFNAGAVDGAPLFGGMANASLSVWAQHDPDADWMLERYNDSAHTAHLDDDPASYF